MLLNDAEQARVLCQSGELDSRPHKRAALKDIQEYWWEDEIVEKITGVSKQAGVEMKSQLTKEEYEQVAEHMDGAVDKPPKKKPVAKKEPVQQTAAQKEFKASGQIRTKALQKLKSLYERVRKECAEVAALLPKVELKGYPSEFCVHLSEQVKTVSGYSDTAATVYAGEIIKQLDNVDAIQTSEKDVIASYDILEGHLSNARKKAFSDIRKMAS